MKETIPLKLPNGTTVPIVTGLLPEQLIEYLPNDVQVVALVDEYLEDWFLRYFRGVPYLTMPADEDRKTLETVERLTFELLEKEADRQTFLVGIGGGLVCDVVGFVAATYMRGMPFGFVPTTLLAQVDAAIGGKNGVNVQGYKNILGTFTQPEFVLCCTEVLGTLPPRYFNAGIAEIIKAALVADSSFFDFIEQQADAILARDKYVLTELIRRAIQVKVAIVERDEKERGERRKLNLGHTVGHAIEKSANDIMHGEAVSIGIVYAAKFSQKQGWLSETDVQRITALLQQFRLPVNCFIPATELQEAIRKDKKKTGILLHYIALRAIGNAVEADIDLSNKTIFENYEK